MSGPEEKFGATGATREPEKPPPEQDNYGKVKLNIPMIPGVLTWARELDARALLDPLWTRRSVSGRMAVLGLLGGIVGLVGFGGWRLLEPGPTPEPPAVYSLRVVPVGEDGSPVEDATVRASVGNEAQRVPGGWEVEIPRTKVQADGWITVWAKQDSTAAQGRASLELGRDPSPSLEVPLRTRATTVRGTIVDTAGRALNDARVSVLGFGDEVQVTNSSGTFVLQAHRSPGERVRVHVEHSALGAVDEYCFAGSSDCYIELGP